MNDNNDIPNHVTISLSPLGAIGLVLLAVTVWSGVVTVLANAIGLDIGFGRALASTVIVCLISAISSFRREE